MNLGMCRKDNSLCALCANSFNSSTTLCLSMDIINVIPCLYKLPAQSQIFWIPRMHMESQDLHKFPEHVLY